MKAEDQGISLNRLAWIQHPNPVSPSFVLVYGLMNIDIRINGLKKRQDANPNFKPERS